MDKDKNIFWLLPVTLFLLVPFLLFSETGKSETEIKVMDFTQLKPLLEQENDTVYVVNF